MYDILIQSSMVKDKITLGICMSAEILIQDRSGSIKSHTGIITHGDHLLLALIITLIVCACIFTIMELLHKQEVQKKMRNMKLNEQKIDVYIDLLNSFIEKISTGSFFLKGMHPSNGEEYHRKRVIHITTVIPCATYSMWYSIGKVMPEHTKNARKLM
ncbi:hypothetical protein ACJX0J_021256 [Zea mays]